MKFNNTSLNQNCNLTNFCINLNNSIHFLTRIPTTSTNRKYVVITIQSTVSNVVVIINKKYCPSKIFKNNETKINGSYKSWKCEGVTDIEDVKEMAFYL